MQTGGTGPLPSGGTGGILGQGGSPIGVGGMQTTGGRDDPASGGNGMGGSTSGGQGGGGAVPVGGASGVGGSEAIGGQGGLAGAEPAGGQAGAGGNDPAGGEGGTGGQYISTCVPSGRAHNPLVTHIFTADPNAVVYGDRVYLYVSHDIDGQDDYDMVDYRGFSSADMVNWQDHGVLIHSDSLPWAENLYAPGACAKDGKYYLYMPNGGTSIGVAVADDPGGPFVDPIGGALLTKSFPNANVPWLFDPACFVDDDGQGYLYFGGGDDGGQNARVVRLNDDMISIKDNSATTIPTTAFFEASFMHKREGTYYFSYSSDFSSGHSAALEYLTSDNPVSGFTYQGAFLPNSNINNGNNNHGSIIDFMDKTYVFYHARKLQQELGLDKINNRSVAVQEIRYGGDGKLQPITMSTEDFTVEQVKCLDGFVEVEAETLAAESGIEVEGKAGETVHIAAIDDGDWIGYSQVDFRTGASRLVLRVASASGGGTIDVRIDGCVTGTPGTSIGTCEVVSTGGDSSYAQLTCPIQETAEGHDLCLVFSNGPSLRVDSWHLE